MVHLAPVVRPGCKATPTLSSWHNYRVAWRRQVVVVTCRLLSWCGGRVLVVDERLFVVQARLFYQGEGGEGEMVYSAPVARTLVVG